MQGDEHTRYLPLLPVLRTPPTTTTTTKYMQCLDMLEYYWLPYYLLPYLLLQVVRQVTSPSLACLHLRLLLAPRPFQNCVFLGKTPRPVACRIWCHQSTLYPRTLPTSTCSILYLRLHTAMFYVSTCWNRWCLRGRWLFSLGIFRYSGRRQNYSKIYMGNGVKHTTSFPGHILRTRVVVISQHQKAAKKHRVPNENSSNSAIGRALPIIHQTLSSTPHSRRILLRILHWRCFPYTGRELRRCLMAVSVLEIHTPSAKKQR